jgi:hypothetical protein
MEETAVMRLQRELRERNASAEWMLPRQKEAMGDMLVKMMRVVIVPFFSMSKAKLRVCRTSLWLEAWAGGVVMRWPQAAKEEIANARKGVTVATRQTLRVATVATWR